MANIYENYLDTVEDEGGVTPSETRRKKNQYETYLNDRTTDAALTVNHIKEGSVRDYTEAQTLSENTGLPHDFVFKNPSINNIVKRKKNEAVVTQNPAMQNVFLQNPTTAGVLQNDIEVLDNVTKSAIFNEGLTAVTINGELRTFEKRPEASDFPLTDSRGFKQANAELLEAQRQFDQEATRNKYRLSTDTRPTLSQLTSPFKYGFSNWVDSVYESFNLRNQNNLTRGLQAGFQDFENSSRVSLFELGITPALIKQQREAQIKSGLPTGTADPNISFSRMLARNERDADKYAAPPDVMEQMQNISESEGFGTLVALAANPKGTTEILMRSMGFYGPTIAAGLATRGVTRFLAFAESGFLSLYSDTLVQAIRDNGVDVSDPQAVYRAISDPRVMDQAREYARNYALPIAIFDTISLGVAGRILPLFNKTPTGQLIGTTAEVSAQAATGASGEFFGQRMVGEYNLTDIIIEAALEVPMSAPEFVINTLEAKSDAARLEQEMRSAADRAERDGDNLRRAGQELAESEAIKEGVVGRAAVEQVLNQSNPAAKVEVDVQEYQKIIDELGPPEQNKVNVPNAIKEQLGQATDVNGSLVIPTSEFLSAFAGTDYYQRLLEHVRLDPGGMTLAEAAAFKQNPDATLQAAILDLQTAKDKDLVIAESRQKVRDFVLEELTNTGRYTPDAADANAQFVASYFNSLGERLGKTPEQAFRESGLNISGVSPGGQQFDQGPATFTANPTAPVGNVTGEFDKPVNLPLEAFNPTIDESVVSAEAIEFARENFDGIKDQPITIDISGDGQINVSEGLERLVVARERGEQSIPAEVRYFDNAQDVATELTPDTLQALDSQQVNTNAYYQSDLTGKDVGRVLRREPTNLTADEQVVFDRYLDTRDDKAEILGRLAEHAGTPWAKQAVEGVFTREAMLMLMRGDEPNFQSSLDSKQVAKLRGSLERGTEGMWSYLEATGGMMGHASKPVNNVNSSFINCNPSRDCAQYCYATQGNYRYANVLVKSEMITMAIELDPVRAATVVAREYKATAEYANKKALRLFDKGDGDAKWLPFIEALNNQDVRVQIFSKQTEFLRAVDDKNLRLLSIDESNKAMADQNPDLPVAFVYSGKHQIADLAALVERGQIQVVLPVKLGRKVLDGSEVKDLKTSVKGIGKYICPIDAGYKKIAKTSDPKGWNCTKCDKNGGLGCFFGKVTKAVRLSDEVKPVSSQEKAKRILELKRSINELNAEAGQDMAEPGSVYSGRSEGLLREVDTLLGELLRDYVPDTESQPAYGVGSGVGGPEFGTGGSVRDSGGTRTDGGDTPKRTVIPIKSYKQGGDGNRGFYSPDTTTITLLESADLTTFLHESGHFFYENNIRVAAELINQETLNESEQAFVDDVSALLRWNGMQGTPREQLNWWFSLEFEEKREYHEQVAESFEKYLFSGKAPSAELQPLFQRFAGWLANVYKSIKEFALLYPRAKKLNPEIRAVFDRMLATTEEINFAEQSRSMQPLFDSPEQASMTPDEYKRYINTALESSAQAQEQLRAKGLRDMQWLSNARTREIKRLQRESRELRNEIRMEERGKVLSQPVYRAWTFLTNRLDEESKARIGGYTLPKSKKGPVDPQIDELKVAIAKLGGLDKEQLVLAWGLDPKDRSPTPLFGIPTYRKKGGRKIDDMATLLAEEGYLKTDENGQYDLAEFETMFMESINGTEDHYSSFVAPEMLLGRPGEDIKDFETLGAGRFDISGVREVVGDEGYEQLKAMGMTRRDAIHPDIVADQFGFDSGQALIAALTEVDKPQDAIEARVDQRMIAEYAELGSDEAIARSADEAIHSEARARFISTELNALKRQLSSGDKRKVSYDMAREYASEQVGRTLIRNISAQKFSFAGRRAAKRATEALKKGDTQQAATEKRNQLLAVTLAKKSHEARGEVDKGLRYLRKFSKEGTRKAIDIDYRDQIDQVLERFDLKSRTNKSIDRRKGLGSWLNAQLERGVLPEIPLETFLTPDQIRRYDARIQEESANAIDDGVAFTDQERVQILKTFLNEPVQKNYKEITLNEFQGLIDTIKQIEHMGRMKNRMLTDKKKRDFQALESEIVESIYANTGDQQMINREPADVKERWLKSVRNYGAGHIKVATYARIFDGGENGAFWEYVIKPANSAGNFEATRQSQATEALSKIMEPLLVGGSLEGKRTFFKSVNRSFTRAQIIGMCLNRGNEGNLQRLLDGEGWSLAQLEPLLESLTKEEWLAIQGVWDYMNSFKEEIGAVERMLTGKEPDWVEAIPFTTRTADGQEVNLSGGYYPVVYDTEASRRASSYADAEEIAQQLRGAYTAATTKQSFIKGRAEKVVGRPLRYSLDAAFNGLNDVIHHLAWAPFLVDANRIMRSDAIDKAIRDKYGSEPIKEIKSWLQATADGKGRQSGWDGGAFRHNITAAGLGYSFSTAGLQIIGLNQSIVRVGSRWIGKGVFEYIQHPFRMTRQVKEASSFMDMRTRTRFREMAELTQEVRGQTKFRRKYLGGVYLFMTRLQMMVDVITWYGGYEKAMYEGNDNERSIALADQGVIDSQGGGQLKDLSRFEREHKMFTVFYSYMNTALNLGYAEAKTEKSKAALTAKFLMLYVVGSGLGTVFKDAITPGDATDDDDMPGLAQRLISDQISYMMGLFVFVRELSALADVVTGGRYFSYSGPIALRWVSDTIRFAGQARQNEYDKAYLKATVNLMGSLFGIPSVQINKTINGIDALAEGDTDNPFALFLGYQEPL